MSDLVQMLIRFPSTKFPLSFQRGEVTYWVSHSKEVEQIQNPNNNSRKIIMG